MQNITESKQCLTCKHCCYFLKNEINLSPYFSQNEINNVSKGKLSLAKNGFYQAKICKSKKYSDLYRCVFLNEGNHKCLIYNERPIDCLMWPFIVGWDKHKKGIYLWVVESKWCPAVEIEKIKKDKIYLKIISELEKSGIIDDVRKGKRYIWPYENYQIKLKKIKI
jgi:Fe-S-cluster containining protein